MKRLNEGTSLELLVSRLGGVTAAVGKEQTDKVIDGGVNGRLDAKIKDAVFVADDAHRR